jgi:hypothetical protein
MKQNSGSHKNSSQPLSAPFQQRLNLYALAAGAAGVGVLALARPAEAKIVYTSANIPIVQDGGPVDLDLNHDGINDFQFSNVASTNVRREEGFHQSSMTVYPVQVPNRLIASKLQGGGVGAAALTKGRKVGPHGAFQPGHSDLLMWDCAGGTSGGGCGGPWDGVKQAYLGLKFVIHGKTHYGWAHIRQAGETNPTIVGYAYETVRNKAITTGKTRGSDDATLGRLAQGASGLTAWRKQ